MPVTRCIQRGLGTMRTLLPAVLLTAFLIVPLPAGAADRAIEILMERVQTAKDEGRDHDVAALWEQVLNSDPYHAQALAELSVHYARTGNPDRARENLRRLKAAHPTHEAIPYIERVVMLGENYNKLIAQARALVQEKRIEEAIEKYREAFGDSPPSGRLGMEFYTTLGATQDGWDEARKGLERLTREWPDDPSYDLAFAKHLTHREATRRDGIAALRELITDERVKTRAIACWRQALIWLKATAADIPLYKQYLADVGEDEKIQEKMAALGAPVGEYGIPIIPGDREFDAGDLEAARAKYQALLDRKPDNVYALRGMAKIAMQEEDFEKATRLLLRVKTLRPKWRDLWSSFLKSAQFWSKLQEAKRLRAQGQLVEAKATLEEAMGISKREAHHARALMGDICFDQGDLTCAEQEYLTVLKKDKAHLGALRGMVRLHIQRGDTEQAQAYSARLAAAEAEATADEVRSEAESLRWQAAIARGLGNLIEARRALEEALTIDPAHEWVLIDLVHLYVELGEIEEARRTLETLTAVAAELPETQMARASVLAAEERVAEALEVLRAIQMDESHADLQAQIRELEMRLRVFDAQRMVRQGRIVEAREALEKLQREVEEEPGMLAQIALAWSDIGEHRRAVELMRKVMARLSAPSISMRLTYAAILLRAERYTELDDVMGQLARAEGYSTRETADHDDLRIAIAIRKSQEAQDLGRARQAYLILQPLLEEFPEDPRLMRALGHLFMVEESYEYALAVFQQLLDEDESDHEAREAAIHALLELGRYEEARELVDDGLDLYPYDPRMALVSARLEARQGNDLRAMEELERARDLARLQRDPDWDETYGLTDEERAVMLDEDSSQTDILRAAERQFGETHEVPEGAEQEPGAEIEQEIEDEIIALRARHSEQMSAGLEVRYRGGESGLGQLLELGIPVHVGLPLGYVGQLGVMARPVIASSGELDVDEPDVGDRFGSIGTVQLAPGNLPIPMSAEGVSLAAYLELFGFMVYVGSTPMGFPLATVEGGARWQATFGGFSIALGGGRRQVRDTMLSMAGAVEPTTGEAWGLVTANGGRVDMAFAHDRMLYYVYGGFDGLFGVNVRNNVSGRGGLGVRAELWEGRGIVVRSGLSLGVMGYRHNLRHFTWGHGGYFSPQLFVNAAVPLEVSGSYRRMVFDLAGDIGVNGFRENDVEYYPTSPALQAARAARNSDSGEPLESMYDGTRSVGVALNLRGDLAYRFGSGFAFGARVQLHFANDYQEAIGGLFVGYSFRPKSQPSMPMVPRWEF